MILSPNESFRKIWRITNSGSRPWSDAYRLVLVEGDLMGATAENPVPLVYPDETVDLSLYVTTPEQPGKYRAVWQLRNEKGELFGARLTLQVEVR